MEGDILFERQDFVLILSVCFGTSRIRSCAKCDDPSLQQHLLTGGITAPGWFCRRELINGLQQQITQLGCTSLLPDAATTTFPVTRLCGDQLLLNGYSSDTTRGL
jgi:hypothetical protein